ncbi:hypothetical protein PG996_001218 [Apiospora saccharicola]|uniref:Glycosyltransferase family 92 protein n=1 Tax=Apiospora saccharicola TaxID=335842 RepID=A0ABR1WG53_9PEZI
MAVYSLLSSPPRPLLARHATRCGFVCAICALALILIPALTLYGGVYYSTITAANQMKIKEEYSRGFSSHKQLNHPASSAAKIISDHRYHGASSSGGDDHATSAFSMVSANTDPDAQQQPRDEYVAICLAVRDQGPDLPEFLQHHYYNIGVRRFYLMDDGSRPPLSTLGADGANGVPAEALTFVYYDESARVHDMQHKVYNDCVHVWGANHTWMAFIDADEFLDVLGSSPPPLPVPAKPAESSLLSSLWPFSSSSPSTKPISSSNSSTRNETTKTDGGSGERETLESILRELEPVPHVGALGVNWQMHTSNGRLTRAESVRAAYTECIYDDPANQGEGSDNKHIKSIVRVRDYERPINPHKFTLKGQQVTVGEHGDAVAHFAFRQPITRDRLNLHHYAVKSRQEYEEKIMRSNAMSAPKDEGFWNHIEHDLPHVECKDMLRWIQ